MRFELPPWAAMWGLAIAIFAVFKAVTWRLAGAAAPIARRAGYLLLWPGMDPRPFIAQDRQAARPLGNEWGQAVLNAACGAALIWGAARSAAGVSLHLAGWAGMVGTVFLLHFGVFRLLGLAWRAQGVDAPAVMDAPCLAVSLSDFWGRRWNSAFRDLAFGLLFARTARRIGAVPATWAVFLASGLIHDLVISVPAGGGYGLPTGYFLLQAAGLLAERTPLGRRLGLGSGPAGRAFAILVVAGPAYWLFHPPFVERVMLPFLGVIGAL